MKKKAAELTGLVEDTGEFSHVFIEDGFVFAAREIAALTAVCSPSLQKRYGEAHVRYDLLIGVVTDLSDPIASLKAMVASGGLFGLPRTTPSSHSLDLFVRDGRLSDWLVRTMADDLDRYTLDAWNGVRTIRSDDKFIGSLRRVFGERFQRGIEAPLNNLVANPPSHP